MFAVTLTLVVLLLATLAVRVHRLIDPACPSCRSQSWQDSPAGLVCGACGWSSLPVAPAPARVAVLPTRSGRKQRAA